MAVLKASKGFAADVRRNLLKMKERLMEKLAAAPVPAEAIDNARQFVESTARDVSVAAQGATKEALQKIKNHLVVILPSLSAQQTRKMVDDAEKEAMDNNSEDSEKHREGEGVAHWASFMSPASSLFLSGRTWIPRSRL